MSPDIRPLRRTRAAGIARTVRYVPFAGSVPRLAPEEYWAWVGTYYRDICPYPWVEEIEEGDFVVIDQSGVNAGLMGSENTLGCVRRGARGFVSNAGVRDTDEIVLQKVPFWSAFCSQSMVQGRLAYESTNVPVEVGGVLVRPGDVVVGDGDGVIVVPSEAALDVARYADEEHRRDMAHRRKHYDALGMKPDGTVAQDGSR
jgi:4-hydroxy-4-methyl-2-oxoglutarate aldolase